MAMNFGSVRLVRQLMRLEARIVEAAEHHPGEEEHERRQHPFALADLAPLLIDPQHAKRDRGDDARRGRNRESR